jgi:3-hydroxybutyryl-CoA dehydrogenase
MGHGIAQIFALACHEVTLTDADAPTLATAKERIRANLSDIGDDATALARVRTSADLTDCVRDADYIVEAVREDLDIKQRLFADIERTARRDPRQQHLGDPDHRDHGRPRAARTRAWNPLVESALPRPAGRGDRHRMDAARGDRIHHEPAPGYRQTPVHVKKDVPGFVGNRLQHALWRGAVSLVEHGICDAETVDTVIKAAFGRRLAVLGPLENADLVGTDLTLAIHRTVLPAIDSRPGPSPYLEKLVANGKLGMKSGEGFRTWTPAQQAELRARVLRHLRGARDGDG